MVFQLCINSPSSLHPEHLRFHNWNISFFCIIHDRFSQRMFAFRFSRSSQRKQPVSAYGRLQRQNIADCQASVSQSTGFIKCDRIDFSHFLQGFSGFYDHSVLRRLPDGRYHCRRRRQYQRAGTEYNQNRNRRDNISGPYVRAYGDQKYKRNQPARSLVGNALHGSLLIFRFLYHAYQFLQGTVLSHFCRPDINRPKTVHCTAEDLFSHAFIHRKGLPRDHRLVHGSLPFYDNSIYRNRFPRKNPQDIALPDLFRRDHLFCSVPQPAAFCRREADQVFDPFLRPVRRGVLQKRSYRHDKSHFAGREQVPDPDGRKHGDADQQSGRDLADTRIVNHSPQRQIEQRNAANQDCHPGGRYREKVLSHQMRNQIHQKKDSRHRRHRRSGQEITAFFPHLDIPLSFPYN